MSTFNALVVQAPVLATQRGADLLSTGAASYGCGARRFQWWYISQQTTATSGDRPRFEPSQNRRRPNDNQIVTRTSALTGKRPHQLQWLGYVMMGDCSPPELRRYLSAHGNGATLSGATGLPSESSR
jgi:hypothetical protein